MLLLLFSLFAANQHHSKITANTAKELSDLKKTTEIKIVTSNRPCPVYLVPKVTNNWKCLGKNCTLTYECIPARANYNRRLALKALTSGKTLYAASRDAKTLNTYATTTKKNSRGLASISDPTEDLELSDESEITISSLDESQELLDSYTEKYIDYLSNEKAKTRSLPMHISISDFGLKFQIDPKKSSFYPGIIWESRYTLNKFLKFKNMLTLYYHNGINFSDQIFAALNYKDIDFLLGCGVSDLGKSNNALITIGLNYFARRLLVDKYYLGISLNDGKDPIIELGFVSDWSNLFD